MDEVSVADGSGAAVAKERKRYEGAAAVDDLKRILEHAFRGGGCRHLNFVDEAAIEMGR